MLPPKINFRCNFNFQVNTFKTLTIFFRILSVCWLLILRRIINSSSRYKPIWSFFKVLSKVFFFFHGAFYQTIHHKSLNTSLKSHPEILHALKYLNNQSQVAKKHRKNKVTKQNGNTLNQLCSKITPTEKHGRWLGSTHLSI